MKRFKIRKTVILTSTAAALAGGAAVLVHAYQSGNGFSPSGSDQEIQANQVVFSDDSGNELNLEEKEEDSDLWKKDQTAADQERPQDQSGTGYLYEAGRTDLSQINLAASGIGTQAGIAADAASGGSGMVYDLVNKGQSADLILPGANGTGVSENNTGSSSPDTGSSGKNNGNTQNDSQNSSSEDKGEEPSRSWASAAKDPDGGKNNPDIGTQTGGIEVKNYDETQEKSDVIIQYNSDSENQFYKGQTVTARILFNGLTTWVWGKNGVQYVWGNDALDKYIRIDSISFDDGAEQTVFPVTIPDDIETMTVKVSYRLKLIDSSWESIEVPCEVADSRVIVLSRAVQEGEETIDPDTILNVSASAYAEEGSNYNLLALLQELYDLDWYTMGCTNLTKLFPGWMENGKLVPWSYPVTSGRHVLEPADMVALDERYQVKLTFQWPDGADDFGYYQTLTGYDDTNAEDASVFRFWNAQGKTLTVPKYIQALDLEEDADITVANIEIPETVLCIKSGAGSLTVQDCWKVDENNPCYTSSEDGLLMNKEETQILDVPTKITELTVSSGIEKVQLSGTNALHMIHLEGLKADEIPEISYSSLQNCKILVDDEQLDEYLMEQSTSIALGDDVTVATKETPDVTYTMKRAGIVSSEGELRKALAGGSTLKLDADIRSIGAGAFSDTEGLTTLIMPENGTIVFEDGWLEGSSIDTILCYTEEQQESLGNYADGSITIERLQTNTDGYTYRIAKKGKNEEVTLMEAPSSITGFDGTIKVDGSPVTVTAIGDGAFMGNEFLEWVTLPEPVTSIGYRAFYGCSALQGILIDARDSVTIGDQAFDNCSSLRFAASNAMQATMENGYTFNHEFFMVPTGSTGYNCGISFTEAAGIAEYQLLPIGKTGKALYGAGKVDGEEGAVTTNPWLLIQAGSRVDRNVVLPKTTEEIYLWAMADTWSDAEDGSYTVNWEELPELFALDELCFCQSGVSGTVSLNQDLAQHLIEGYAFYGCTGLSEVAFGASDVQIGEGAFNGCTALTSASFGNLDKLCTDLFYECDSLEKITFAGTSLPSLILFYESPFRFNSDWEQEEEYEKLHLTVSDGLEEDCVKIWRYRFAGYADITSDGVITSTAYQEMWQGIWSELCIANGEEPSREEVDALMKERLLEIENGLRKMLGLDSVKEPTDYPEIREQSVDPEETPETVDDFDQKTSEDGDEDSEDKEIDDGKKPDEGQSDSEQSGDPDIEDQKGTTEQEDTDK